MTSATLISSAKREGIGLPSIYQLKEPHPMRNPNFTRDLYPEADQRGFRDYLAVIEKTEKFMEDWLRVSEKVTIPLGETIEQDEADGQFRFSSVNI